MPDHLGADQRKTNTDPEKEKEDFQGVFCKTIYRKIFKSRSNKFFNF